MRCIFVYVCVWWFVCLSVGRLVVGLCVSMCICVWCFLCVCAFVCGCVGLCDCDACHGVRLVGVFVLMYAACAFCVCVVCVACGCATCLVSYSSVHTKPETLDKV